MLALVNTKELILNVEVGVESVNLLTLRCQVGNSYRVTKSTDITQLVGGVVAIVGSESVHHGVHDIVLISIRAISILTINRHVGGELLGDTEEVAVVLLVVGISQREVGSETDALTHVEVEGETGSESVEHLLDDGTCLVSVTGTDTEGCLLSTT